MCRSYVCIPINRYVCPEISTRFFILKIKGHKYCHQLLFHVIVCSRRQTINMLSLYVIQLLLQKCVPMTYISNIENNLLPKNDLLFDNLLPLAL